MPPTLSATKRAMVIGMLASSAPLTPELKAEIEATGTPRWIVGPNRIHYWWIPDWHRAFPEASVYLAPRIREQAGDRIDFDCQPLDRASGYPWDAAIATLPVGFNSLRIGGPSGASSPGPGAVGFDNILLETVAVAVPTANADFNGDNIVNGNLLPEIAESVLERMAEGKPLRKIKLGAQSDGAFKYSVS